MCIKILPLVVLQQHEETTQGSFCGPKDDSEGGSLKMPVKETQCLYSLVSSFSRILQLFILSSFLLSPGLSLLLLPLLMVQTGSWGFPADPLSLQELRREFTVSLYLARKLLSEVQGYVHSFVSLLSVIGSGGEDTPKSHWPSLTELTLQAESRLPGVNLDLLPVGHHLPNVSLTFQAWRHLSVSEGQGLGRLAIKCGV